MGPKFPLLLKLVIFFLYYKLGSSSRDGSFLCRSEDSRSLLQLKQQLPPSGLYKWYCPHKSPATPGTNNPGRPVFSTEYIPDSWTESSDCCEWDGIKCNRHTGRVIGLNLTCGGMSGTIDSNSSLFQLTHLRSLDLSYNLFHGWELNVFESGQLPNLVNLDLSYSRLKGLIPPRFFMQLHNLRSFRLNENSGLMGTWPDVNQSHFLEKLELRDTGLGGQLPYSFGSFFNALRYMDLSGSKFSGSIPESIGNITQISGIHLKNNQFSGHLPSTISNLRMLKVLDISFNNLQGQIPDAFFHLQNLTTLLLGINLFDGPIPSSLTNLSQLRELDLSSNALTALPFNANLHKVSAINLSRNKITGTVPLWLLNLASLQTLDLHSNYLRGQIVTKFQTKQLTDLDMSNNQLNIDLAVFSDLNELQSLKISGNRMVRNRSNQFTTVNFTLPNLSTLIMSSCELRDFPADFLRNLSGLLQLDLSNNEIQGPTPEWFISIPSKFLQQLDLSFNYLTSVGDLPWSYLINLNLQANSLQGEIPLSISNMSQLVILNLSNNKMSGEIPHWIGNFSSSTLWVLDLRRNGFYGIIPEAIGEMTALISLGLNGNQFKGRLPRSLQKCSNIEVLDLGNNMIDDTFPRWLQKLSNLKIIILKSNKLYGPIVPPLSNDSFTELRIIDLSNNIFSGNIPEKFIQNLQGLKNSDTGEPSNVDLHMGYENYQLSVTLVVKGGEVSISSSLRIFTTIDLSSNNFSDLIPESLGDLRSLRLLNLSHNSITGNIPQSLGRMLKIEQLDFSWNQLSGEIPNVLTNLTFLTVINLSYNHLTGRIPSGNQFWTFSNESYKGNLGLCGYPLTRDCDPISTVSPQEDDSESLSSGFGWKAVVIGYGCGTIVGFIIGNFMLFLGKPKWFVRLVPVEIVIWITRLKKTNTQRDGRR